MYTIIGSTCHGRFHKLGDVLFLGGVLRRGFPIFGIFEHFDALPRGQSLLVELRKLPGLLWGREQQEKF